MQKNRIAAVAGNKLRKNNFIGKPHDRVAFSATAAFLRCCDLALKRTKQLMMKKTNLSLKKLRLSKDHIGSLEQLNATGGLNATSAGCHSVNWVCGSYDTNCFSACQGGCDQSFTCGDTRAVDCTGSTVFSVNCSFIC